MGSRVVCNAAGSRHVHDLVAEHADDTVGPDVRIDGGRRRRNTGVVLEGILVAAHTALWLVGARLQCPAIRNIPPDCTVGLGRILSDVSAVGLSRVVASLGKNRSVHPRRHGCTAVARYDHGDVWIRAASKLEIQVHVNKFTRHGPTDTNWITAAPKLIAASSASPINI